MGDGGDEGVEGHAGFDGVDARFELSASARRPEIKEEVGGAVAESSGFELVDDTARAAAGGDGKASGGGDVEGAVEGAAVVEPEADGEREERD